MGGKGKYRKKDTKEILAAEKNIMKYTIKDSVFTHLFSDKKYLIQLYRALHPEDKDATENELTDITIRNVLTDNIYNDLGFMVGERLMILVEAQSSWSMNIIIRVLMYLAQTYHDYFERTKQDLYNSKKVQVPKPEAYVIYTGKRKGHPENISLSEEFFGGEKCCLDVTVKMVYDGEKGDIIHQYVAFTKVCDEQIAIYGRTKKAIFETIRICKDENVLKEYLESREKEVVDIMMILYDAEEVLDNYVNNKIYEETKKAVDVAVKAAVKEAKKEARKEGMKEGIKEGIKEAQLTLIKNLLKDGTLPPNKIAEISGVSLEMVRELENDNKK